MRRRHPQMPAEPETLDDRTHGHNTGMKKDSDLSHPGVLQYIVCYVVWMCLSAMTLWLLLQVRTNLVQPLIFFGLDPRAFIIIDRFSLIVMALIVVAAVFLIENALRISLLKNSFWLRVVRILTLEAIVLVASYILQFALRIAVFGF